MAAMPLTLPFKDKNEALETGLQLERTFEALKDVLAQETAFAKKGKLRSAATLQSEKMKLTDSFLKLAERLRVHAGYFRSELPDLTAKLQKLHGAFCEEVHRNLTTLATAKALSETLIQEIIDAAKQSEQTAGYTAKGSAPSFNASGAPPLKLNMTL